MDKSRFELLELIYNALEQHTELSVTFKIPSRPGKGKHRGVIVEVLDKDSVVVRIDGRGYHTVKLDDLEMSNEQGK